MAETLPAAGWSAGQGNRRWTVTSAAAEVDALDKAIRALVEPDDDQNDPDRLLQSVPGIGKVTSATLLAAMRELGQLDRRVPGRRRPFHRDSGKKSGKRSVRGGRAAARCGPYMAALWAVRFNPAVRAFARGSRQPAGSPRWSWSPASASWPCC